MFQGQNLLGASPIGYLFVESKLSQLNEVRPLVEKIISDWKSVGGLRTI